MANEYQGMTDEEAIAAICRQHGCQPDSDEAQVRLLLARGIMTPNGEIKNVDGTTSQY